MKRLWSPRGAWVRIVGVVASVAVAAALATVPAASAVTHDDASGLDLSGYHTLNTAGAYLTYNASLEWKIEGIAGNEAGQLWNFVQQPDGSYTFASATAPTMCLDVYNGSSAPGAVVDAWACTPGSTNQEWNVTEQQDGTFAITSVRSGLLLTNLWSSEPLEQQNPDSYWMQKWTISGIGNRQGTHRLVSAAANVALDDPDASTTVGQQLITWTVNGGPNQSWVFSPQTDGSYLLINTASGLCADVWASSFSAGAVVDQYTCSGSINQRWIVTPLPNGLYTVASAITDLLLTTAGTSDGALTTQQTNTASSLQQWSLQ